MRSRRAGYGAALAVIALTAAGISLARPASDSGRAGADDPGALPAGTSTSVLKARFAVLDRRHTNQCGLRPESLQSIAVHGRLQGSCCKAMNFERYAGQVRGLAGYRGVTQIPADPYDIPVAQARQLLAYDRQLALSAAQQATYKRAITLSHEHGPCCCHCWRWNAFEGQAKYLIMRRGYSASRIAQIWNLEDGCGGA